MSAFYVDHKMNFPEKLHQQLGKSSPVETRDRGPYEGVPPILISAGVGIWDPKPLSAYCEAKCIAIFRDVLKSGRQTVRGRRGTINKYSKRQQMPSVGNGIGRSSRYPRASGMCRMVGTNDKSKYGRARYTVKKSTLKHIFAVGICFTTFLIFLFGRNVLSAGQDSQSVRLHQRRNIFLFLRLLCEWFEQKHQFM